MYSCVFWCEFIDLVRFFGCYGLTPFTPKTQEYVKGKSPLFIL